MHPEPSVPRLSACSWSEGHLLPCLGLRGNQRLPLIRHIFAHLFGLSGIEKALVTAQLDTNAPASGSRVDQDQFLAAVCSRARRFAASTAAPASITCPLCPISAPQELVRAAPRTAAALMRSARSRVRPRPRRSPIFVRRYQGPHAQSRAGTYDPDRTGGLPSSRPDRKHVRVGRHCCCSEIINDLQRAQSKASMQITGRK